MEITMKTLKHINIYSFSSSIKEDAGHKGSGNLQMCLVNSSGSINFSTVNLLLTGRASPFLHNGVEYGGSEHETTVHKHHLTSSVYEGISSLKIR